MLSFLYGDLNKSIITKKMCPRILAASMRVISAKTGNLSLVLSHMALTHSFTDFWSRVSKSHARNGLLSVIFIEPKSFLSDCVVCFSTKVTICELMLKL